MEHFISLYIDNELDLDEKIRFITHCYQDKPYVDNAVSLLEQEKQLRVALHHTAPDITGLPSKNRGRPLSLKSISLAVAACMVLLLSFLATDKVQQPPAVSVHRDAVLHRFVIYQQGADQVEITGSFTHWQRVPLLPAGTSGYWEVRLPVPAGEHRYSYVVDNEEVLADPTVIAREADEFGTANSIIRIEA